MKKGIALILGLTIWVSGTSTVMAEENISEVNSVYTCQNTYESRLPLEVTYAYLCLYKRSNEQIYLQYAEKHAQIVRKLLKQDQRYDVLSGNAGTAWSFVFQNSML